MASVLPALIAGQIALHAAMAGQRMAAPLQALQQGHSAWAVGVLLALFAALPVVTALAAGRMADRHGYHRPLHVAVGGTMLGAGLAFAACFVDGWWRFGLLCVGAAASGVGTNVGLIAIQRTAGHLAGDSTERMRVFSWLGMAPSLANVVGPVAAGFMIDAGGFAAAYALLFALPLLSLITARRVPVVARQAPAREAGDGGGAWDLLATPGLKRLLFVNWLLSASWDVHSFAVPVLGFDRGYSASTIGIVLGSFTLAVTLVRFIIPLLAHRLREVTVLRFAMVLTGIVFTLYPFAKTAWMMGICATLLGLTLGAVQPMIMSTLHHLTPEHRHGEAIAFRSMAINFSSSVMPLAFGLAGSVLGPGVMFWIMGAAVGAGSWVAKGLTRAFATAERSS
ncbi:MFS transporter [Aquincola sp. S2]|uniref:MFS transporter n=1 Tax=Pseudaquabacterium terrae TaxID=2732868 RepID=A0ABX2EK19_9BURK|nr:MFS transporter [Aquabacterium terrae]NRF68960.1 MFS transporter [Aquabacterium terrae]